MTLATVVPMTSELAPTYVADTLICGGVTFGYFAIGNVSRDNSPKMEMTSEMTMAKNRPVYKKLRYHCAASYLDVLSVVVSELLSISVFVSRC